MFNEIWNNLHYLDNYLLGILLIAPLFQIQKLIKNKNSQGVSLWSWASFIMFGLLLLYDSFDFYAGTTSMRQSLYALAIILENIVIISLIFRYKRGLVTR